MSQQPAADAGTVRRAADQVKAALDRHLAAVEQRAGEADERVYEAFRGFRAALLAYDAALYDVYDEVAPYDVVEHGDAEDTDGVEVDDPGHDVRRLAEHVFVAIESYLGVLQAGEPEPQVAEAEEVVAGGIGSLLAVIEQVYGRRVVPYVPPSDWDADA